MEDKEREGNERREGKQERRGGEGRGEEERNPAFSLPGTSTAVDCFLPCLLGFSQWTRPPSSFPRYTVFLQPDP